MLSDEHSESTNMLLTTMANYEPRIDHNILFHILDDSNTYEICGGEKDKKQKAVEQRTLDRK